MYHNNCELEALTVNDLKKVYGTDLKERLFTFALNVMKAITHIPNRKEFDVFRYQLSKSALSIGANFQDKR